MPLRFTKQLISSEAFESAGVFDVNNDGIPDIVSGEFWYEGPRFIVKHRIGPVQRVGDYYDDFSTIPVDVNGDGRMDFITGGWWGNTLRWRENLGDAKAEWPEHVIAETGNVETTRAWDVDGDGFDEYVPNTPGHALCVYKLQRDAAGNGTGEFTKHCIYKEPQGHGLGFGDVNGDGRGEFILVNGWLEAPANPLDGEWILHNEFDLSFKQGAASVPVLVVDVNGDGLNDLIVGNAHGYGLDWVEQRRRSDGTREWVRHPIDPYNSQYHDLQWADLDGDGECELITGKRYLAHPHGDGGIHDDLGICYFKWNGESFSKQFITFGPLGVGAGCGIHFALADLRGTGRLDVIAPGKDGLHVFFNEGL
jgi:hypothetical protein